ncbi:MAG: hypothetical protein AB7L65_02770, partial [Hyphomonadaceae bacterium]
MSSLDWIVLETEDARARAPAGWNEAMAAAALAAGLAAPDEAGLADIEPGLARLAERTGEPALADLLAAGRAMLDGAAIRAALTGAAAVTQRRLDWPETDEAGAVGEELS